MTFVCQKLGMKKEPLCTVSVFALQVSESLSYEIQAPLIHNELTNTDNKLDKNLLCIISKMLTE